MDPGKPERTSNNSDPASESNFPQFDSRVMPSNPTDTQDRVCTFAAMPSAREQGRSISTLSISSAPPNVSEVVTQV